MISLKKRVTFTHITFLFAVSIRQAPKTKKNNRFKNEVNKKISCMCGSSLYSRANKRLSVDKEQKN